MKVNWKSESVTPDTLFDPKLTLDEAKQILIGKKIDDIYYSKEEACLVMVVEGIRVGIYDSEQYFSEFGFSIEGRDVIVKHKP